ncbi:hypothetical protein vseg_007076 [Gypsophila vaccaria]
MHSTILLFISTFFASIIVLSGVHGRPISKAKNGLLYDCVDYFKQPAFSHSLLRNHTSKIYQEKTTQGGKLKANFGKAACPYGTVPIIRTNKNDSFSSLVVSDQCPASVRTKVDQRKFYGAEGSPSLNKPKVNGAQWSSARMKLSNGPESIEVGWMVNPSKFKDEEAHFYVQFQNGGSTCLNTECPGFVHVSKDVPLGMTPDGYSQYGGQQYTWKFFIDKHQDDGHWWLSTDDDKYAIGYWPKSLFGGLADHATQVEWGGVTSNPGIKLPLPEMGYGSSPDYNTAKSAFFQHVTVVDESFRNVNPDNTEKSWDCAGYTSLDWGYQGDYWGRLIFYGGPPN